MPAPIKLPRLPVNWKEQPQLFERYWDDAMSSIETTLNAILAIPEIAAAVAAAQAAAAAAQAAADSVTADTSIASSYVTGLTLEAFNDGADCHVDISAHMRVYGDGTTVAVNGDTIPALPFDTIVRVYYDQASRAGGAVAYQWTSDAATAAQTGDRHSVGAVVTPRPTEPGSVLGGGVQAPGFVIP